MSKALEIAEIGNSLSVDGNGNLVFEAGVGITADVTGNADTATTLETARTINSVSFDGSANITVADSTKVAKAGDTMTGNLSFGDNNKAIFGAGSDLQIYHNVNNSYIQDVGTGKLHITSDGTGVSIDKGTSELMATFDIDGAVTLYHDNAAKLTTTATGIDVTGTAVTDGLTVAGNLSVDGGTIKLDGNYPVGTGNVALGDAAGAAITSGGRNTLIGGSAGDALTVGQRNVVIGTDALSADTQGSRSVAIGQAALANQNFTSATDNYNVAVGFQAGVNVSTGINNTLIGGLAGAANTTASNNTAVGYQALYANTTGTPNVAVGYQALLANTTGVNNVAMGQGALSTNITGTENTAVGNLALRDNTGLNNSSVGYASMLSNTSGADNAALGTSALRLNTTGAQNTAIGISALYNNTTASNNVAVGYQAGYANTTGASNNFLGYRAGYSNTTGGSNTYIGLEAGYSNLTSGYNVAIGNYALKLNVTQGNIAIGTYVLEVNTSGTGNIGLGTYDSNGNAPALKSNTTGSHNVAIGVRALTANTTGYTNVAIGLSALAANTTGINNVALGANALDANTTANENTAVGYNALTGNTTGNSCVAVGFSALANNTTANANVSVGRDTLYANTTGASNVAIGYSALGANTTASENTAVGYQAAYSNTTGVRLVAVGYQALLTNTTGTNNVAVGKGALQLNTTGSSNIGIGYGAGVNVTTGLANTLVGNDWTGVWGACGEAITTGSGNSFYGTGSGRVVTTGSKNTIIGGYSGNQGGLDIRTSSNNIVLSDGDGNPRVVVDSSGNVGIGGAAQASSKLFVDNGAGTRLFIGLSNNIYADAYEHIWRSPSAAAERMRINSSGDLLVGKTASNSTVAGSQLNANGLIIGTTSGTNPLLLNRLSTDGDIITMQKDGTAVGSIGTAAGGININSQGGDFAIRRSGGDVLYVGANATYPASNNGTDLGVISYRWKDLYLSGGVSNPAAGGTLKFSTVGAERMRISSTGNVGIGTTSPTGFLHIQGSTEVNDRAVNINMYGVGGGQTGVAYGLKAEVISNNGSSDTYGAYIRAAQGVGGNSCGIYANNNPAGYTQNSNVRSIGVWGECVDNSGANGGSPYLSTALIKAGVLGLVTDNGTGTNATNAAVVANNQSSNGALAYGVAIHTSAGPTAIRGLEYDHNGSVVLLIASTGNVTNTNNSYGAISDLKLKENISYASSQWDDIKAVQVKNYSLKTDELDAANRIGVIAQDLEASGMGGLVEDDVMPIIDENGMVDPTQTETIKQVKYSVLYMKAVKALQEAMTRIEDLEANQSAIEIRLAALEGA